MDSNRLFCPFLDELLLPVPLYHAVHLDLPPLLRIHRRDRRRQPRGGAHWDDQAIISLGMAWICLGQYVVLDLRKIVPYTRSMSYMGHHNFQLHVQRTNEIKK